MLLCRSTSFVSSQNPTDSFPGRYKGQARYKDELLDYLDRMHALQVEAGVDTASSKYPF